MAIKCSCCNNMINEGDAQCNECGMSVILDTCEDGESYENAVNDYKSSSMSGTDISIVCYKYTLNGDHYGQPEEVLTKLCNLSQYCPGDVVYLENEFNSPPLNRSVSVELRFNGAGKSLPVKLEIKIDGNKTAKRLGISFGDKMTARLVVLDNEIIGYSSEFKLINIVQ